MLTTLGINCTCTCTSCKFSNELDIDYKPGTQGWPELFYHWKKDNQTRALWWFPSPETKYELILNAMSRRKSKTTSIPLLSKLMNAEISENMSLFEFACIVGAKNVVKKLMDYGFSVASLSPQYLAFVEEDVLGTASLDRSINTKKRKSVE